MSSDKFGLDAELAAKEAAKFNPADEKMVVDWIRAVTGNDKGGTDFMEWLKDGKVLITLGNKLAGASLKANEQAMPFKQMENIANFLKLCREHLGMRENDLFTSADLYDGKSRVNVINGLIATSRAASKKGYSGPSIAPKESTGGAVKHHDINTLSGEVSKLSMGSAGVMERSHVDVSRDPTFGAKSAGTSADKGGATKLSMGSAGVMDKVEVSQSNNIDFGAKMGKKA